MNGAANKTTDNGEQPPNDDILQPSTSHAGLQDEPKWNVSTRQLYQNNLIPTGMTSNKTAIDHSLHRQRVPSTTDSTSSDDSYAKMYRGDDPNKNGDDIKTADCSSPEMDYLEMDFDPCQSNGQESSDSSYCCEIGDLGKDNKVNIADDPAPNNLVLATQKVGGDASNIVSCSKEIKKLNNIPVEPVATSSSCEASGIVEKSTKLKQNVALDSNELRDIKERTEPSDGTYKISQKTILCKHISESTKNNCCISSVHQALSTLCGVQTLLNKEEVDNQFLSYNKIEPNLSLVDYLFSVRGGLVAAEIMSVIEILFSGFITSRFFFVQPHKKIKLSSFLLYWMKKDVVPILSMNFNLTDENCNSSVNASWHFQLVKGVCQRGIYLFSQKDSVSEELILKLLQNPSEILISREEILARWTPESDLNQLMTPPDHSWKKYNVLGQIVNIVREGITGKSEDELKHVKIPSSHQSGILLLIRSDNPNLKEFSDINELPFCDDLL